MYQTKGYKTYKKHWEDQANFMDKEPWHNEKIIKLTISNEHERDIEKLRLTNHSLKKEHGNFVLKLKVPYNYIQLDDFELKAIELLGIKKNWLTNISIDNSNCTH